MCLSFDDWESESRRVPAGVLHQGSPISPPLFSVFIAPLYDKPRLEAISLGSIQVSPQEDAGSFGIVLDRKLKLRAHCAHITNRSRTHKNLPSSCIAAKTWGPALLRTLAFYKAVIRSIITYAASAITSLAAVADRGKATWRALVTEQNEFLRRRVTGAYKSTLTKTMESLDQVPTNQPPPPRQRGSAV